LEHLDSHLNFKFKGKIKFIAVTQQGQTLQLNFHRRRRRREKVLYRRLPPGDSRLEISTPHPSVSCRRDAAEENVEMKPLIEGFIRAGNGNEQAQVILRLDAVTFDLMMLW
jgi:hypothetical protein